MRAFHFHECALIDSYTFGDGTTFGTANVLRVHYDANTAHVRDPSKLRVGHTCVNPHRRSSVSYRCGVRPLLISLAK